MPIGACGVVRSRAGSFVIHNRRFTPIVEEIDKAMPGPVGSSAPRRFCAVISANFPLRRFVISYLWLAIASAQSLAIHSG